MTDTPPQPTTPTPPHDAKVRESLELSLTKQERLVSEITAGVGRIESAELQLELAKRALSDERVKLASLQAVANAVRLASRHLEDELLRIKRMEEDADNDITRLY